MNLNDKQQMDEVEKRFKRLALIITSIGVVVSFVVAIGSLMVSYANDVASQAVLENRMDALEAGMEDMATQASLNMALMRETNNQSLEKINSAVESLGERLQQLAYHITNSNRESDKSGLENLYKLEQKLNERINSLGQRMDDLNDKLFDLGTKGLSGDAAVQVKPKR